MKRRRLFSGLKSKKQIASLFKEGKKLYAADCYLRFLVLQESAPSPWMVLIALPRSLKTAVARNRAKRIVRAALEIALVDVVPPVTSCAVAVFVKESFVALTFPERVRRLRKIFSQVREKL